MLMPHLKFLFSGIFFSSAALTFASSLKILTNLSQCLTRDCCLDPGTMAAKFGLPDDEIDRLLAEAEARLSGNGNASSDAVAAVPPAKALAPVGAPVASLAGEQTVVPEKKPAKLSVRVPQPVQKKKVRAYQPPHSVDCR